MKIFLHAKHWQLFIVAFAIPIVFQMILMFSLFSRLLQSHDPYIIFNYIRLLPIIIIIFVGAIYGWQWSVAIGLQKMLPAHLKMKINLFKAFLIIPLVYICSIIALVLFVITPGNFINPHNIDPQDMAQTFMLGFLIIFPIHVFSVFCAFYNLYFISKTIKMAELQRPVTFSDYIGEFFLTWFFPVGVWILQPKINKMVQDFEDGQQSADIPTLP